MITAWLATSWIQDVLKFDLADQGQLERLNREDSIKLEVSRMTENGKGPKLKVMPISHLRLCSGKGMGDTREDHQSQHDGSEKEASFFLLGRSQACFHWPRNDKGHF